MPSIRKQGRPMLCLAGSEIQREGLKTNAGLTVSLIAWDAETKVGLNEP